MEKTQQILLPADQPQEKPKLELKERVGIVEAILFVTGNAVEKKEICRAMELTEGELEETLDALESGYDFDRRGLRLLGGLRSGAERGDVCVHRHRLHAPCQ